MKKINRKSFVVTLAHTANYSLIAENHSLKNELRTLKVYSESATDNPDEARKTIWQKFLAQISKLFELIGQVFESAWRAITAVLPKANKAIRNLENIKSVPDVIDIEIEHIDKKTKSDVLEGSKFLVTKLKNIISQRLHELEKGAPLQPVNNHAVWKKMEEKVAEVNKQLDEIKKNKNNKIKITSKEMLDKFIAEYKSDIEQFNTYATRLEEDLKTINLQKKKLFDQLKSNFDPRYWFNKEIDPKKELKDLLNKFIKQSQSLYAISIKLLGTDIRNISIILKSINK